MRYRYNVRYEVSNYAGLWYDLQYKRWIRSDDKPGKKGRTSHVTCRNKKAALRHIRQMQSLTDGEVYYTQRIRKGTGWKYIDYFFGKYEEPASMEDVCRKILEDKYGSIEEAAHCILGKEDKL